MKKVICFIAFVLAYFGSVAQTFPQNPTNGQVQINNTNLGGGTFNRGVRGGVFVDTSSANDVPYMKGTKFMLISTTSDNNYWYRSADTMRWELIATTTSNCPGTSLISGSITWSGSGLVYDATDLDYYIICSRYFANATTLTLSVADPTYARIDKFYADITGTIGVITGTPSANPQEPAVNPLSQIDMGFVYIPAGSTVPAGTTQTVIYNENVEWSGTSDVPSINFSYGTNPYIGSVSTYIPNAPNSSYVEWQSNGVDYLFSEAQYLKFWVRLNANFSTEPLSFLDVTFEYTDVTVSQTLSVGNGDYNMDYSLIDQWQLVSIPLTGITTFGTEFNEVHFVINSAPTSFQLDYVYLLETATVPPVIGSAWSLNLNTGTNTTTNGIGTSDSVGIALKTNNQTRVIMPADGLQIVDDTSYRVMLWNETTKEWAVTYQPTILADSPVVIYQSGFQDRIKVDTTRRGAAVATQYYADSVSTAAGANGWGLTGNAGTNPATNFIGPTDNVDFIFKRAGSIRGRLGIYNVAFGTDIELGTGSTGFGDDVLLSSTANTNYNTGIGFAAMQVLDNGENNVAAGYNALITLTDGNGNTAIGANADVSAPSTDSSVAIGYQATASTKQLAFSPHLATMFLDLDSASGAAPAIAGIDASGNWRKYATPSGATLTSTYVGVGNASNQVSGSSNFTDDGALLKYSGSLGMLIDGGGLSVTGGTVSAIDYTGDWYGGVINPQFGGTGVNNGSSTITLGGNLTTSGAFASTFTMTAATGVTFPTTGTLATLAGSETFTNKTLSSPVLSGTMTGSGTIGGGTVINTTGSITGFNIVATGLVRSAASSAIEHNGRNKFTATSDGFETLTANSGTANTANLSVASLRTGYVAKTANYTATAFDETISCSTNAFTITLPTAVGCAGQKYNITNSTAANTITINTTSSQTFANVTATPTSISLVGLGAVIVVSDGANWLQLK